jgi:hypothetical protein
MKYLLMLLAVLSIAANSKADKKLKLAQNKAIELYQKVPSLSAADLKAADIFDTDCYYRDHRKLDIECVITDQDKNIGWKSGLKITFKARDLRFETIRRIEH